MKACAECAREILPWSRHRRCPGCRAKNLCQCGQPKMVKSATCSTCRKSGGESNANWRGGRTTHKRGYVMVWVPEHPRGTRSNYVFEHILVMEVSIGRSLIGGESVHHRNGVRSDNRMENLELWTRPQPTGIRVQIATVWARNTIELYDNREVISSPTTTEANLGNPWRRPHHIRTARCSPSRPSWSTSARFSSEVRSEWMSSSSLRTNAAAA